VAKKSARRIYGTGSVVWLSPTKVKLRVRTDGAVRSTTVRVAHRDHGGRGEAEAALEEFRVAGEAAPAALPAATWTLKELMERYVADRARVGKAKSTLESYENVTRRLTDDIAVNGLDVLAPDDLDLFYGALAKRGLSPNTIRQTHAVLSAAMGWAEQKGKVPFNVVTRATPPDPRTKGPRRLSVGEVQQLVAAAHAEGDVVLAMAMFLALYLGARRGELCGLRWQDFNPNEATVRIERQLVPLKGGQQVAALKSDTGTIDGARTIPLGPEAVDTLQRYRVIHGDLLDHEPDGWLLSYDGGSTPIRAKTLGERVTRLGRKLGIEVSLHSFRRTADTQLVAAGVDVDTAARRSGHTREVMFKHYVQGADDRAVAAALTLESRLINQGLVMGELLTGEES
jgi:integrase